MVMAVGIGQRVHFDVSLSWPRPRQRLVIRYESVRAYHIPDQAEAGGSEPPSHDQPTSQEDRANGPSSSSKCTHARHAPGLPQYFHGHIGDNRCHGWTVGVERQAPPLRAAPSTCFLINSTLERGGCYFWPRSISAFERGSSTTTHHSARQAHSSGLTLSITHGMHASKTHCRGEMIRSARTCRG